MSITIGNAEAEAILADLSARTSRAAPDLLLDLLRRERGRLEADAERRVADGLAADETLRQVRQRLPVDARSIDEILAYDENGLPV